MSTKRERQLADELAEAERTIADLQRRQKVDELLARADAVDLAAARLLTERAIVEMPEAELDLVIEELQQAHPNLFRRSASRRRDLIRYLRGKARRRPSKEDESCHDG